MTISGDSSSNQSFIGWNILSGIDADTPIFSVKKDVPCVMVTIKGTNKENERFEQIVPWPIHNNYYRALCFKTHFWVVHWESVAEHNHFDHFFAPFTTCGNEINNKIKSFL
jgi:hypothetical protein